MKSLKVYLIFFPCLQITNNMPLPNSLMDMSGRHNEYGYTTYSRHTTPSDPPSTHNGVRLHHPLQSLTHVAFNLMAGCHSALSLSLSLYKFPPTPRIISHVFPSEIVQKSIIRLENISVFRQFVLFPQSSRDWAETITGLFWKYFRIGR